VYVSDDSGVKRGKSQGRTLNAVKANLVNSICLTIGAIYALFRFEIRIMLGKERGSARTNPKLGHDITQAMITLLTSHCRLESRRRLAQVHAMADFATRSR
jgi:Na+/H+ antiporter NhaC